MWYYQPPHPYGYQYPPLYPPPYWIGKRQFNKLANSQPIRRNFNDNHDDINSKLLAAVNKQNELLERALMKLSNYVDKNLVASTQDWNYIQPYLKQEVHENMDKKEQYDYDEDN